MPVPRDRTTRSERQRIRRGSVAAGVDGGLGGEEDAGGGAAAGLRVADEFDGTAVFDEDALRDPQAEAGAAFALGGEEGLEEVFADLGGDSGPVIDDFDDGPAFHPVYGGGNAGALRADADGNRAALAGGLGGVGDEVGEDLAELGGEPVDGDLGREVGGDGDAERVEAALHQQQQVVEHVLEVDWDGRLGLAIEAEHGAADLGDAGELGLCDVEEMLGFSIVGIVAEEVEQVGDGVERIVDLVGDGGGEASGDGKLLVGEQGGAGPALHGDVAEDHDDAGEFAFGAADGRAGVVDGDLGAVFADEDGVVGDADDAIGALDLGDRVIDGLAGCFVDDVEDLLDGAAARLGLDPSSKFLGNRVHHQDFSVGVAGDDSITDGGEGGAQILLGVEELLGAEALEVEGFLELGGDGFEALLGEQADEQANGQCERDEYHVDIAGLATPLRNAVAAPLLGGGHDGVELSPHGIHSGPAGEVEVVVRLVATGGYGCDDLFGKGLMPEPMFFDELLQGLQLLRFGGGLQLGDGLLHGGFGVVVGPQKTGVGGDLVSAQAGLFVDDKFFDQGRLRDVAVGILDQADGEVRPLDLPDEYAGEDKTRDDGKNQDLPEGSSESYKLQRCRLSSGYCDPSVFPDIL